MCVACKDDSGQQECVRRVRSGESWTKLRKKAIHKKSPALFVLGRSKEQKGPPLPKRNEPEKTN